MNACRGRIGVYKQVHKDSHKPLQHGFKLSSEGGSSNSASTEQTGLDEPLQFAWQRTSQAAIVDLQRELLLLTVSLASGSETASLDRSF